MKCIMDNIRLHFNFLDVLLIIYLRSVFKYLVLWFVH